MNRLCGCWPGLCATTIMDVTEVHCEACAWHVFVRVCIVPAISAIMHAPVAGLNQKFLLRCGASCQHLFLTLQLCDSPVILVNLSTELSHFCHVCALALTCATIYSGSPTLCVGSRLMLLVTPSVSCFSHWQRT